MQKPTIVCIAAGLVLAASFLIFAPLRYQAQEAHQKFTIVATTTLIADIINELAHDTVNIHTLMGPGVDPHSYHARLTDVKALTQADIILYHGLHLEGKMVDILEKMQRYRPTYAVTDSIDRQALIASDEFDGMYDPHVWFDIDLWQNVVHHITQILSTHLPAQQELFKDNQQRYIEQLNACKNFIADQIAHIDQHKRYLITSHDAFSYFGRAFGLEVLGIQGINLDSEPGIKDMQSIVHFISTHQIPTLFLETSLPHRSIEAIAQAVHARGWHVAIGDELYSDALGYPESNAASYIGMMKENVQTIVQGLSN